MATYRSDRSQLTFAAEAAQGGYPEPIYGINGTGTASLSSAADAGSKKITVSSTSGLIVGDFIIIGDDAPSAANAATQEIRRIEFISGSDLYLDRPTAFYHAAGADVEERTSLPVDYSGGAAETVGDGVFPAVTWLPGVYDTVTLPEPVNTIEPTYFLGTDSNRNFTHAYRGSQSYDGSLTGITLLNGWPLRFPIGKVSTVSSATPSGLDTTLSSASKKGDTVIDVASTQSGDPLADILEGQLVSIDDTSGNTEIRQVIAVDSSDGGNGLLYLNYPLTLAHAASATVDQIAHVGGTPGTAGTTYTHTIAETTDLDTISWSALFKDSADTDGNALIRRYYGGMVSSATISAEEGGLVQMSWDSVPFMGMVHNIKNAWDSTADTSITGTSADTGIPGYHLTGDPNTNASLDYVGVPLVDQDEYDYATAADSAEYAGFPTTEPYYFSQGVITMHGATIARVRDFSLSIDNAVEPRYYIEQRGDTRRRGPSELHEQRRTYSMTATLVPDSIDIDGTYTADSADAIFSEYLLQGDYGNLGANQGIKGFKVELQFSRSLNDYIKILVDDSTASQGSPNAVLTAAPVQIDGNNPLQLSAEILIKSLSIEIKDNEPYYP